MVEVKKMNEITEGPQLSVDLEFEFMGADLTAAFAASADGVTVSFSQTAIQSADSISLPEMVCDFNRLVDGEQITEGQVLETVRNNVCSLNPNISEGIDFSKIKFRLKELHLNIFIGRDGKKSVSYAITLEIILDGILPGIKVFHIKSLSLSLKSLPECEIRKDKCFVRS